MWEQAKERRDEIRALELKIKELEREQWEDERECRIHSKYKLSGVFVTDDGEIRLSAHLTNEDEKEEFLSAFGSIGGNWDKTRGSVQYKRVGNVLLHGHGGWCLLADEQEISDEEWEDLKNGIVAEKLRTNNVDDWEVSRG